MNRFFTNKKLIVLLISVIIFISLVTLSMNTNNNVVQSFSNDITAFVGRAFSKPIDGILGAFDSVEEIQQTFEENQVLKREINQVYEKDAQIASLKEENKQLKAELEVDNSLSEFTTQAANVISRNPDRWVDNLIIDAGSDHGVANDMPVMSQNGLIGIVSEVNYTSSKVTLLTNIDDSSNRVSAQIIKPGQEVTASEETDEESDSESGDETETAYGIISEYRPDTKELLMTQVTSDMEINEGDLVSTSGLGGMFPSGLLIGRVKEVALDSQGLGQIIYVEPATDFDTTKVVTVVERVAEVIDDEAFQEESEDE